MIEPPMYSKCLEIHSEIVSLDIRGNTAELAATDNAIR